MLSPIEKLYLKTFNDRYRNVRDQGLRNLIEEQEHLFRNSQANSPAQRQAVLTFMELLYYEALLHLAENGDPRELMFMASASLNSNDGLIGSLNNRNLSDLAASRTNHWFIENADYQYGAFVDTPPNSIVGQRLRTQFNTLYTAPRFVKRDFVLSRVKE